MLSHWDSRVDLSDKFCGTSQFFSFAMWKLDEISIIHFSMTWTLQENFCHGLHGPLSVKMVVIGRKKRNEMMRAFRFRKYHTRASALLKSSLEPKLFLLDSVTWNCARKPGMESLWKPGTWKACVWGWLKAAWSCYYVGDKVQNTSIILWHVVLENKAVFSLCTKSPSMRLLPLPNTHTHTHTHTNRHS